MAPVLSPLTLVSREREDPDHGLSFWGGELRPWSEFWVLWGRGRRGGSQFRKRTKRNSLELLCPRNLGVCSIVLQKTCAVRPVFARVAGELGVADPRLCSKGP